MEAAEVLASAVRLVAEGFADSDEYWNLIRTLHRIPEQHVFDLAAASCVAASASERAVGADVLAQLGSRSESNEAGQRPFTEQSASILRGLLQDHDEEVLIAAIHALGHHSIATADDLRDLAVHPSVEVRHAVACALDPDEAGSQQILFALMNDADAHVRDWSTFAIGSQSDADTPEIHDALASQLTDPDDTTRGEAMIGLARRGDLDVVKVIVEALGTDPGGLVFDAADALLERHPNEPRLIEALAKWRAGA